MLARGFVPSIAMTLAVLPSAGPAWAQAGPGAAIEAEIAAQMQAFREDDPERAFSHASPGIRAMFGSPEAFAEMVARGYPVIRNPGTVRFLGLRADEGGYVERLAVESGGASALYDYRMVETPQGWRIDAVTPVAEGPGV